MSPVIKNTPNLADLDKTEKIKDHPMSAPHGGNLTTAVLATGLEREDFLDFSVNLNPLGLPSCVQTICSHAIDLLSEYPDPNYGELKRALANALDVSTDCVMVGNGSTELIYLLPHLLERGKEILIVAPCFSEYERAFQLADIPIRHFPLDPSHGFSLPVDRFLFQVRQFPGLGGIIIGHPNNPTGALLEEEEFLALSLLCEQKGIFLIIDETFIDFAGSDRSFANHVASNPHQVVIRSMTKFYSLPGLRLGYGIMHPEQVGKLEAYQPPWSVNGLAQAIGSALVRVKTFPEKSRNYIQREKVFLYENLNKIPSIEVFPSQANFLLFRLMGNSEEEAKHCFTALLHQGIVIRHCGNFKGLNPGFFRLAVKSRNDNQRLIASIHDYFQINGV